MIPMFLYSLFRVGFRRTRDFFLNEMRPESIQNQLATNVQSNILGSIYASPDGKCQTELPSYFRFHELETRGHSFISPG
jgi:hypothetical protein